MLQILLVIKIIDISSITKDHMQEAQNEHKPRQQSVEKYQQSQNKSTLSKIIQQLAQSDLDLSAEQINQLLSQPEVDRMLGSMFGAFIADSLGSYCQFSNRKRAQQLIQKTMEMPGGGTFNIKAGQVTDDSQMALHMLQGLLKYQSDVALKQQASLLLVEIAKQYVAWMNSRPFDIGITCRTSIQLLENGFKILKKNVNEVGNISQNQMVELQYENLQQAWKDIQYNNQSSLSNGFLMRITPMACFHYLISKYKPQDKQSLKQFIFKENKMTHSNKLCHQASFQYIYLIDEMIQRKSHEKISELQKQYESRYQGSPNENSIPSFVHEALTQKDIIGATERAGFFKIAYNYTFYFLKKIAEECKEKKQLNAELYKHIISRVISEGGDTDTNACIVGGVIGSIVGFANLPAEYLIKMFTLRLGKEGARRGANEKFYEPRKGFVNLIKLILKIRKNKEQKIDAKINNEQNTTKNIEQKKIKQT